MKNEIFNKIDDIISNINKYKIEPLFSNELNLRINKKVPENISNNEMMKLFVNIIVFSQNANSKLVQNVIKTGIFDKIFKGYDINEISEMNPCDLADEYWEKISSIRQQAKLFHIVSLSRKLKKIDSFDILLHQVNIPKNITSEDDIDKFWKGFKKLKKIMEINKIPFFRSTISLLHLLLEIGYDCVKPDLVVMKVSKKIGIVKDKTGDKNYIKTVRTIQKYSIDRNIKPSIVDLYFLIDGAQLGAKELVSNEFYNYF